MAGALPEHGRRVRPPLADSPFGPWLTGEEARGERKSRPGPLQEANILDVAVIYNALYASSQGRITPRDADELYIWEIAVLLGVSSEVDSLSGDETTSSATTAHSGKVSSVRASSADLLRQRVAHAKGQGPAPEAQPMDKNAFQQLTQALG